MTRASLKLTLAGVALGLALATPTAFAGTRAAVPLVEASETLTPGQYVWDTVADVDTGSEVTVVVSLPLQRLHVYRDGVLIAASTVSTGKPGHDTPAGVFPILQKKVTHRSNLYDDASMPFMQRLTWDGVALHAGRVSGTPASHGCVRLPRVFAAKLYDATRVGATVIIVDSEDLSLPALLDGLPPPDLGAEPSFPIDDTVTATSANGGESPSLARLVSAPTRSR